MTVVCIAIGNSDDKLGQQEWARYITDVHTAVDKAVDLGARIQFCGYSAPGAPWQNALWAVEIPDGPWSAGSAARGELRAQLAELAGRYRQDSIAWWEADATEFIPPAQVPA
jgi:hypothetical protein